MCSSLAKIIKPITVSNITNFLQYETIFSTNHIDPKELKHSKSLKEDIYNKGDPFYHGVENRPDGNNFLNEGLEKPVRPENVRY